MFRICYFNTNNDTLRKKMLPFDLTFFSFIVKTTFISICEWPLFLKYFFWYYKRYSEKSDTTMIYYPEICDLFFISSSRPFSIQPLACNIFVWAFSILSMIRWEKRYYTETHPSSVSFFRSLVILSVNGKIFAYVRSMLPKTRWENRYFPETRE